VSGELHLANSGVAPLVTSLAALAEAVPIGEFAVIGGLAVLARLQGAHRVTYDLDTVATQHGDELTAVETVISVKVSTGSSSVRRSTASPLETCRRATSHRTSCQRGRQTASLFWLIVGPSTLLRTSRSSPKRAERWWPRLGAESLPRQAWWP